ncbi:DinB family protein [Metabacillus fastidiosus]|uniref:DinB family protein n=1 Tax=Metabacillus fastidiosus TaxID=1458 RepID=A0ABU6P004_9BACI|nr:DinB family protein [Metabacillus fastidiosus]MED4402258.1 DinB family protein [Metabacillus fastidiosus]MED4462129.1 DinB family protein [Metabacillus fastidiosus]
MNKLINDNLYETRKNLVEEIDLLSNAQFNSKPDMNMWSIAQVCHHLVLVEEASIKAIAWGLKENDHTQKERKNVHFILLDRTKKIKAPKIVEPDVKSFEVPQIIDLLNDSRKKLITFLSTIEDKAILKEKSMKHPALGELPLDQWIEQIYLHEQRHIEQIKEIKLLLDVKQ